MSAAYECDDCGNLYKKGFTGLWKKTIMQRGKQFYVDLRVSGCPHLCKKCWPKFAKSLFDDLKTSYVQRESIKSKT